MGGSCATLDRTWSQREIEIDIGGWLVSLKMKTMIIKRDIIVEDNHLGSGVDLVVSVLAFYSDNMSLNPAVVL